MDSSNMLKQPGFHCHKDSDERSEVDKKAIRQLVTATVLCLVFMIAEIVGGVLANSLAIATDAAHLMADLASFLISLLAIFVASRPATQRMTFGWHRAEVVGALVSVLLIWVVTAVLVYMAVLRVMHQDYEINAGVMMITAGLAVVFNICMMATLHNSSHGHSHGGLSHAGHSHGGDSHTGNSHGSDSHTGHSHGSESHAGHSHGSESHTRHSHGDPDNHSHDKHHKPSNEHVKRIQSNETGSTPNGSTPNGSTSNGVLIRNNSYIGANYGSLTSGVYASPDHSSVIFQASREEGGLEENSSLLPSSCDTKDGHSLAISDVEKSQNINVRAAFIHVIGDLIQSFGVLIASFIIYYKPAWKLADPICTFLFSVLALFTTVQILRDVMRILLEGTPRNISFQQVKEVLSNIEGVKQTHDLNIWALTTSKCAVSVHLAIDSNFRGEDIVAKADQLLREIFNIHYCTIQTEICSEEQINACSRCDDPRR